jgi:hypothetical protein
MPSIRILLCGAMLLGVTQDPWLTAQGQPSVSAVPTIQVTSRAVFLDVTVLDKQGHPVVSGLTKDDFSITEDKKPQPTYSFDAPEHSLPGDPRQQTMDEISEAAQSIIPFDASKLTIVPAVRHPDSKTAELTVLLKSTNVHWQPTDDGGSATSLTLATVGLAQRRDILASKLQRFTVRSNTQDAKRLAASSTLLTVTKPVPNQTRSVRVIDRTAEDGQIGAAGLDRMSLNASPEAPTPDPVLLKRPRLEPTSTEP